MPPKRAQKEPKKKKDNVDKTFGMKNKNKSTKVQKFIKQVELQADPKKEELRQKKLKEKQLREAAEAEKRALLGQTDTHQRVRPGVDPKSILCAMFKIGNCNKGAKCKFSHDMTIARKVEKIDLFSDARKEKEQDTMDQWDEAKLRSVILSKHGNLKTTTDKICKFFLKAIEVDNNYGWFWECPNGRTCMYKHSLPEGYVIKTAEQKKLEMEALENQPKITLENFIETEREKLDKSNLTPITKENFREWSLQNDIAKINIKVSQVVKKTGREVVLMKMHEDKKWAEDLNFEADKGTAFDLAAMERASQLEKAQEAEANGEAQLNIKDYGDGSNPIFF
ncbi:Translation machinery-associated protein 46 [Hanseniaspora osmophila]|uniref:Translation machinery-associated protein 46 n=1 Tax=Hanseniaspora osmophila TaxID=56408 RepID=A0A1E5RNF3_9ASCO|nr:Translation machinery-associated protein 46 [Hanseniaspora osmophila]